MRKLQWEFGRAWIAVEAAEWMPAIRMDGPAPTERIHSFTLPATAAASGTAVAVKLKNFNASTSSYFACLGGQLAPGAGSELAVTLRLPEDSERASDVVAAVVAGIESVLDRPAGRLTIWCPFVHPFDLKPWAWDRCAATMLRLMLPDVAAMSGDDAVRLAGESVDQRMSRPRTPEPRAAVGPALFVADDVGALVQHAADQIRQVAASAVRWEGRFRVALAGGSTPRALYPQLVDGVDWKRADVFFGDERAVPPDDPQSNYRMARETLLAPARVPDANVFRWQAESADLEAAARAYEQALRTRPVPPQLDLALLGLGPDGHTASLFPATAALAIEDRFTAAVDVPALGARRLTLTYPAFLEAGEVFFLVTGRDKRAALADVLRPESTLPAARIVHRSRSACIFCDREAAPDGAAQVINAPR